MKNILVTGANGFIARSLIPMLCNNQFSLRVTSKCQFKPDYLENRNEIEFISFDFGSDTGDFDKLVDGIDTVVHLAGKAHSESNSEYEDAEHQIVNY